MSIFALLVTALAVSGLLQRSIAANTQALLTERVAATAELAASGNLDAVLDSTGREVGQVQVVDDNGVIVSRTRGLADSTRFDVVDAQGIGRITAATVDGADIDNDANERYRLVAQTTATPSGPVTVYTVTSLDSSLRAQRYLRSRLLVALPLLGLFTGAVIFWVVGRSLQPVEQMPQEVERISVDELAARVSPPDSDDELARLGGTLNGLLERLDIATQQQKMFAANAP